MILQEIVGIIALLACSAFMSGSETSLFSMSALTVRRLQHETRGSGPLAARLLSQPRDLLITILCWNILVNTLAASLAASLFRDLFAAYAPHAAATLPPVVSVVVMTLLLLMFGEVTPKRIALIYGERLALRVTPVIFALSVFAAPVRWILRGLTTWIVEPLVGPEASRLRGVSDEELRTALAVGLKEGVVEVQERNMIHGALLFAGTTVEELMKPRTDILAFDVHTPLETIARRMQERDYSRAPVFEGTIDSVIGILERHELLRLRTAGPEGFSLRAVLRPAFFVPETMRLDDLLDEFRSRHTHFALAVDEYGSVSGLITLEDVLEVVVGRLDLKQDEVGLFAFQDERTLTASGQLSLLKLNELLGTHLEDEYAVTLGGLLAHRLGRIPSKGDLFETDDLRFEILSAKRNRVEQVAITRKARGA